MATLETVNRPAIPGKGMMWALPGAGLVALAFQSGLVQFWFTSEEYGHGPLILAVLGYLLYRERDVLPGSTPDHRLVLLVSFVPFLVLVTGAVSGITQLQMYAVWLYGVAVTFALGGVPLTRHLAVPLAIALMTIPLPSGAEWALTAQLQLISSELGVWFIRQFGGVVLLQGNVIDMGSITLLVDEACSGLRYLYPLLGLGAIAAYLFNASPWARWTLFLATIPITIFMNSFRIGVTGILVDHYGLAHTEGFLHFFEGWIVFLAALVVLVLVAWLLLRLQRRPVGLIDAFSLEPARRAPGSTPHETAGARDSRATKVVLYVVLSLVVGAAAIPALALRAEVQPDRAMLAEFPSRLGSWTAQEQKLPLEIEQVAGATDYFYANFSGDGGEWVNLYLSYYASQRDGQIPHSPRLCIPGNGWEIASLGLARINSGSGSPFTVNRVIVEKGGRTLIGYYWLKQGSAVHHQESAARLDLIRSSVMEGRTDGALIRILAELGPQETIAELDRRLEVFSGALVNVLPDFVPD